MYGAIWRLLPGPLWLRVLLAALLLAAAVAACFVWLFPWVATVMPFNDGSVSAPSR